MARSSWCRVFFPPYYKYAVFLLSGFELIFSCLVLSIAEAYYKTAALLLPISYRIFDDTVSKKTPNFNWTEDVKIGFELYKTKMLLLWVTCTVTVLVCMLVIIPQFFDFNDAKGNRSHLCLVRHRLGWFLFVLQAALAVAVGVMIVWAWYGCGETVEMFRELFDSAHHEEVFVSELENKLDCETDDDKEVPIENTCRHKVHISLINKWWMDAILIAYIAGHIVIILLTPLFNRQLFKREDDLSDDKLMDSA